MNKEEEKIAQFCIDAFMGKKTPIDTLNDLYKIVDKIEKESYNGEGVSFYKTKLATIPPEKFEGPKYVFSILLNQTLAYQNESSLREASTLYAIIDFCKDWYLAKIINDQLNSKRKIRK